MLPIGSQVRQKINDFIASGVGSVSACLQDGNATGVHL